MPDLDFLYSTTNFFTWNFQYLPCLDFLFKPTDFPHEFFTLCPIWTFYTRLTFFHVNFSVNASFGLSIQYYHLFTWIFQSLPFLDFLWNTTVFSNEFVSRRLNWTFYTVLPIFHMNFSVNAWFGLSIIFLKLTPSSSGTYFV